MDYRNPTVEDKPAFNQTAAHPLQSWEWGEFRKDTGIVVEKLFDGKSGLVVTFHKLPIVPYTVGYVPRSPVPTGKMLAALRKIGNRHSAIFIKLEPNTFEPIDKVSNLAEKRNFLTRENCVRGRALFTDFSFQIDLTLPEDELLARMKSKTRYNIRLAERKGVKVEVDNSDEAFVEYLMLLKETTKRQNFYAHDEAYQRKMWKQMKEAKIAHLLKATFKKKTLVIWIVFVFNGVLYYPYGVSTNEHRELMASNLLMWEVIKFGKKMKCKVLDMWGALGPEADKKDPWYGFHRFKEGYGGTLMEFVGSYDLVLKPLLYPLFRAAESLRWWWLRRKANSA